MPHQVADLVRHFVGYMHLDQLQNKAALHYEGVYYFTGNQILTADISLQKTFQTVRHTSISAPFSPLQNSNSQAQRKASRCSMRGRRI